jgi:hypothetical protein
MSSAYCYQLSRHPLALNPQFYLQSTEHKQTSQIPLSQEEQIHCYSLFQTVQERKENLDPSNSTSSHCKKNCIYHRCPTFDQKSRFKVNYSHIRRGHSKLSKRENYRRYILCSWKSLMSRRLHRGSVSRSSHRIPSIHLSSSCRKSHSHRLVAVYLCFN